MKINKRSLPIYVLLNCLTLGIYGALDAQKMGNEINALCKGDNEKPCMSYMMAVLIRGIAPIVGLLVGFIIGLINTHDFFGGYVNTAVVFTAIVEWELIIGVTGSLISSLYLNYWWYKQAKRLKLNAWRYGLAVNEGGTDTMIFRTVANLFLLPITALLYAVALLFPFLICYLIGLGDYLFALIMAFIFLSIFLFFAAELNAGASFSKLFLFKNMNRYADAARNGAAAYDPMGYTYYMARENGPFALPVRETSVDDDGMGGGEMPPPPPPVKSGKLIGMKGSCAGYEFELRDGERVVIGKDAKVSSIVIDPAYKEVSRKHVAISYNAQYDQYEVVDYSSNGTFADGNRLETGHRNFLNHGTNLKLANDKTIFRLV